MSDSSLKIIAALSRKNEMTRPPKDPDHAKDPDQVRIIFVGDVVGKPGMSILCDSVDADDQT